MWQRAAFKYFEKKNNTQNMTELAADVEYNCRSRNVAVES